MITTKPLRDYILVAVFSMAIVLLIWWTWPVSKHNWELCVSRGASHESIVYIFSSATGERTFIVPRDEDVTPLHRLISPCIPADSAGFEK